MANALRLAPLLLIAIAVEPAAAEPQAPEIALQSMNSSAPDEPVRAWRQPALGPRLFQYDRETWPDWTLPFGPGANDADRRGLGFGVRPGRRGLKATARLRF